MNKVSIGIISYNDISYLEDLFDSLISQTYKDTHIIINNISDSLKNRDKCLKLCNKYNITCLTNPEGNVGFGGGHNFIYKNSSSDIHIILNSDMIIAPTFIEEIVKAYQRKLNATIITGKIYLMQDKKTIDSCGLKLLNDLNCIDMKESPEKITEIYGASGVCIAIKRENIKNNLIEGNIFDPLYFMYKEDIDLAFRLCALGHKSYITPYAIGYHDRTLYTTYQNQKKSISYYLNIIKQRSKLNKKLESWSYYSHQIYLLKYISFKLGFFTILSIIFTEFQKGLYALLFKPFLLKEYLHLFKIRKQIKIRRASISTYNYKNIKKWINQ